MTLKTPLLMQAAGGDTEVEYSALDVRALLRGVYRSEGVVINGTAGSDSLKVSQRAAGANFTVDVAAGHAVIDGDDVSNQGPYLVESTAVENVVVPSPPGAGTRTHRVVARLKDHLHDGTWPANTYTWTPEVLEDTGSGTPAVPNSAIPLARVAVSAGQASVQNAHITDDRVYALTIWGRPRYVSNDADRPANPVEGWAGWRQDKDCLEIALSDGSWVEIPRSGGGGSAWTAYTPTLTASTTNPTMGTGSSRVGAYQQVGKTVHVRVAVVFGTSGAAAGSGTYRVSLPVTAKTLTAGYHLGSSQVYDSSANNADAGVARIGGSAGWSVMEFLASGDLCTNAVPWTWANGDAIYLQITYEAA